MGGNGKACKEVRIGNKLMFTDNVFCDVIDNTISGGRVVRFEYDGDDIYDIIDKVGISPLPPYIKRKSEPSDKERYQTVFAEQKGAVAAPTAGLHFTQGLIENIVKKGAKWNTQLFISAGTFRPVQVEDLNRHQMDSEYFEVSPKTALSINETKKKEDAFSQLAHHQLDPLRQLLFQDFARPNEDGQINLFILPMILKWSML